MKKQPQVDVQWKSPPLMPEYIVSTDGRVRRVIPVNGSSLNRDFKPFRSAGRWAVKLQGLPPRMIPRSKAANKKFHNISIARLMLYTFVGPPVPPLSPFAVAGFHDKDFDHLELSNLFWAPDERIKFLADRDFAYKKVFAKKGLLGHGSPNRDNPERQTP